LKRQSRWTKPRGHVYLTCCLIGALAWLLYRRAVEIETGDVYARMRLHNLVLFYSLNKHCAGWFINRILHCPPDCVIHLLPTYHVVKLWDYDRERS
jgi:hypothetical protein